MHCGTGCTTTDSVNKYTKSLSLSRVILQLRHLREKFVFINLVFFETNQRITFVGEKCSRYVTLVICKKILARKL